MNLKWPHKKNPLLLVLHAYFFSRFVAYKFKYYETFGTIKDSFRFFVTKLTKGFSMGQLVIFGIIC